MRHLLAATLALILSSGTLPAEAAAGADPGTPLWLRYPALSPDGETLAFNYRGRIYTVPAAGGTAIPLTLHDSYAYHPVWSRDGSMIAFASDRHGNFDVYVMPSTGGEARRLTHHSGDDVPTDFSPDGGSVIFSATRVDAARASLFPSGVLPELYRVSLTGGAPAQLLTTPAQEARYDASGARIVYQDRKGYEDPFRKHHVSSVTRDIFVYDEATGTHTRVSMFEGEDRDPAWSPGGEVLYLSERSGSLNVWRARGAGGEPVQVTHHERHPVRSLSVARDGSLAYSWNGELYVLAAGAVQPRKVAIGLRSELQQQVERNAELGREATELAVSPDGKEIALVIRGEVFVTSADYATTKRVTDTPTQERSVSFSPDGRCLLYAAERGESWDVYRSCIRREDEPRFTAATVLQESPVVATEAEEFQPAWSPDGREVAYLEDRTTLKVRTLSSGDTRTVLPGEMSYSYSDGDQWYAWSPDGRWFAVQYLANSQWTDEVGLVPADGSAPPVNLTMSGYSDERPQWMPGGMLLWFTDRHGMRSHGSWGSQQDAYGMFLTQASLDRFDLSKEEWELLQENEEDDDGDEEGRRDRRRGDRDDEGSSGRLSPVEIELDGIRDRTRRLTIHSSDLADAVVTPDASKLVYLSRFEDGHDLWVHDFRERETKLLAKLDARGGQLALDDSGEAVFVLSDGAVTRVELDGGDRKPVALAAEMSLDLPAERAYLFEHAWRQVREKFYDVDLHGVDWEGLKSDYARFLPHINNNHDFAEMLSEMLGELNASHTGARYRPRNEEGDRTAALGLIYDWSHEGPGLRVAEVLEGGPLDQADSRIRAGHVITAIDGVEIAAGTNPYALLNRKQDARVLLAIRDPQSRRNPTWEEVVQPVSLGDQNQLLYERWVENRRAEVERLSGGRLGYVHVRGMNDASFRSTYSEVLGRAADKEGLVVDTRFNGGGWLHDDLATFLSGERYATLRPRGQVVGFEPMAKWDRPSVVVMSESNYSDAHIFPWAYSIMGIGQTVGMPVPGTGTAVWWENLQDRTLTFGIPQVGVVDAQGRYLENQQLEPDHRVWNDWGSAAQGRDKQLERAVEVLLRQIDRGPAVTTESEAGARE